MSGPRRKPGKLGPHVEGYRVWLARQGYTPGTIRNMLKDLGHVGRWLSAQGLGAGQLDEERMVTFLASRRDAGQRRVTGPRAMAPLLRYLREIGVADEAQPSSTPLGRLLTRYRSWMIQERVWPRPRCCAMRTPRAASCRSRPPAMVAASNRKP